MKKTIGVTIDLKKGLWSSGINQNAIYLCEVLKNAGYNVTIIYHGNDREVDKISYIKKFNPINIDKRLSIKLDLLITLGVILNQQDIDQMRVMNSRLKVVAYKCGNEFFSDMENILFGAHESRKDLYGRGLMKPDQIWVIPQMEETNLSYYRYVLEQDNATVVPFIWSPMAIEDLQKKNNYSNYQGEPISSLAVMEPNISVFKNILFPIVALNRAYNSIKNKVGKFYMIGSSSIKDSKVLYHIVAKSKMFKDNVISFDGRIQTTEVLNKHANIVFSWQMHNPLNYLYLDIAWLGYPIVHNGYMCKDVGYFYNEFDEEEAASVLTHAISAHQTDQDYMVRNRQVISRYLPTNKSLINQYRELVEDVLNDRFEKKIYNSETNTLL